MEIIRGSNLNLRNQVEESCFTYDFHDYLIFESGLIYNAITGEIIKSFDYEEDKKELIKHWFMLPIEFDQKSLLYYLRQNGLNQTYHLPINEYTIFTTMRCNAGCSYCFQHGGNESVMSIDTANDITTYILNNCDRARRVTLRWFGGEPLLNKDAITTICKNLRVRGINYISQMSSNGDLFDGVDDSEIYLWNLQTVQFTVDRPGSDYDNDKGLSAGGYDRLLKTVERFESLGVGIQLRIHYHPENGLDISKQIVDDFSKFHNVYAYPAMIYDVKRSKEDYEKLSELEDYMLERGLLRYSVDNPSIRTNCMADNDRSTCIRVDGSITPCEHFSEGEKLGSIYESSIDEDMLLKWKAKRKHELGCVDCPLYPACEILSNCPATGICEDGYKEYRIRRIKRSLRILGDRR